MPQTFRQPFMARTMVEAGQRVKVPVLRRFGRFAPHKALLPNVFGSGYLTKEPLRIAIAVAAVASLILGGVAAHADKRMFIVANDADGYGVDRCLISNAPCGTAVANSYCHSHEYDQALSFQKVDRGDITGATPASGPGSCQGRQCDEFVAIE
jgi:hypothetical protein